MALQTRNRSAMINLTSKRQLVSVMAAGLLGCVLAQASDPLPALRADGTFEDGGKNWQQESWKPKPAPIVSESGEHFVSMNVPKGFGSEIFADASIPAGCGAIKVKFRARCHQTGNPDRPSIMVMFGTRQRQNGKPIRLTPDGQWQWHEVVVRFRADPKNDQFKITSIASPLAVDIDDITFSMPTAEEAQPPLPEEGPGR